MVATLGEARGAQGDWATAVEAMAAAAAEEMASVAGSWAVKA
jgi:hypothetical protein